MAVVERPVTGQEVALPGAGVRLHERQVACRVDADDARQRRSRL
jgi:hypothetical protein